MNAFGDKFRLIILPFMIVLIATLCAYTFVHWWLFVANEIFLIDEDLVNFAVPIVVFVAVVWIWLRPRLKLLDFKRRKLSRNPLAGYFFIATITIAAPIILAQTYLISATGKLTELGTVSRIDKLPKTKYYKIKKVFADKEQTRSYTNINVSGKYNIYYNMMVYMPCPIYDAKVATTRSETREPLVWLGIKYQKTVSNGLSAEEKTEAFAKFLAESEAEFEKRDLTTFTYLDRIGLNRESRFFAEAITFSGVNDAPYILLVPRWSNFEDRNGVKGEWFVGSLIIGILLFTTVVAAVPLKEGVVDDGDTKYVFEAYKLE